MASSGNQFGCDISQMDQLSTTFQTTTTKLQEAVEELTGRYQGLNWQGPDSEEFQQQMIQSQLRSRTENVVSAMEDRRTKVEQNRERQMQASA